MSDPMRKEATTSILICLQLVLKPGRFFEETGTAYLSRAHGFTLMPFYFSCEVQIIER
jgi:hypothetical protein